MNVERGLVSVVIPTHNGARYIREALDSVLRQTYAYREILVVDDASTDETQELLVPYGDRIRCLRVDTRRGPGAARNVGIRRATGEFIAFLDSDDMWLPEKLTRQVELLTGNPALGMVGGGCMFVDPRGQEILQPDLPPETVSFEDIAISTALPGSTSNALVRRSVLQDVGLFDESLQRAQDRELWMRIIAKYPVKCVMKATAVIRVHDGPRPNTDFELIKECRIRINARILDRSLRRKADAWMWFNFFMRKMHNGAPLGALIFLVRSFATYPRRISHRRSRLQPAAERLLPDAIYRAVRSVVRLGRD